MKSDSGWKGSATRTSGAAYLRCHEMPGVEERSDQTVFHLICGLLRSGDTHGAKLPQEVVSSQAGGSAWEQGWFSPVHPWG